MLYDKKATHKQKTFFMPTLEEYNNAGDKFRQEGKIAQAIEQYSSALSLNPDFIPALVALADLHEQRKEYDLAIKYRQQVVKLTPNNSQALARLANLLSLSGKKEAAIKDYEKAIALSPSQPAWVYLGWGDALKQVGRGEEALEKYQQGVESEPDNILAWGKLAHGLMQQGHISRAIEEYNKALSLKKELPAWLYQQLGDAYQQNGQVKEAIACYQQAGAKNTQNPEYHYKLGKALAIQKKWDEAIAAFHRTLELQPDFIEVHEQLANAFHQRGKADWEKALTHYDKAMKLDPGKGEKYQRVFSELREVLGDKNKFEIHPVQIHPPHVVKHSATVALIICIHNALEAVKVCLESVIRYTLPPYSLIIVNDGSNEETSKYLENFAKSQKAVLLHNNNAQGYTLAANQGLRKAQADYALLLNSDTIVTPGWLDRMIACAKSDPRIGIVGPLSNTASWQSVPEIFNSERDWAENRLPEGITSAEQGRLVAKYSAKLYPTIPFLNGFCLMIKRQVIEEIGYFDEEIFGKGYGEENDYCLRTRKAGWKLALADDAYVYHHQSLSYSRERRQELSAPAHQALFSKYGKEIVNEGVTICSSDFVFEGIRARCQVMNQRQELINQGQNLWEGKRVYFILPMPTIGGGANVIFKEAKAMERMGLEVKIINLKHNKLRFEQSYPDKDLPVIYLEKHQISELLGECDAILATYNASVYWLEPSLANTKLPIRGYYIQDFEPYFFPQDSENFRIAWESYTHYPDLVRITKTQWNRDVVSEKIGVECYVNGPSVDLDLYRPRPRREGNVPDRPLRILAMIRSDSPRRAPKLTMEVLREFQRTQGENIEIIIFGCGSDDPEFLALPRDFPWRNAGILTRPQVAALMNEVDIFVDFSSFQALGLTAMEAMCCGVAVIVPQNGGSSSFVNHEVNGLIADSSSKQACFEALKRLVSNEKLRTRLQRKALFDICQYFPEKGAFNTLKALFPG